MDSSATGRSGEGLEVRHFREILLWPLQLVPARPGQHVQRPWEQLHANEGGSPWSELPRVLAGDSGLLQARHYSEFVTFLPTAQRFLYGEADSGGYGESPIRIFSRTDLARLRLTLDSSSAPVELSIAEVFLHFFYDIDVVILTVEVYANGLDLDTVQEILFRLGRSYPAFWDEDGRGGNCFAKVEWLSATGELLVASDYENQERYLGFVGRNRVAAVSSDWMHVMRPLIPHTDGPGEGLRYRQLEYLRMPLLAYVALDEPRDLTRADFARLALATRPGPSDRLPFSERSLQDFEENYCLDQFWGRDDPDSAETRFLCTGNTLVVVGEANRPFFTDPEHGVLGQFRHQYFLLGLISHFHKAALLMFSDRMVNAVSRLDIRATESIKSFKREVRMVFEIFLRFTHRYWFYEVSLQSPAKPLFAMWERHLGTGRLYDEIRREVQDMAQYLDSDSLRRQANTVVRLTVVTTVGLVGTIATGFLGMNLIAAADEPLAVRTVVFGVVLLLTIAGAGLTILRSKRIYDFLENLSDERLPMKVKIDQLFAILWRRGSRRGPR